MKKTGTVSSASADESMDRSAPEKASSTNAQEEHSSRENEKSGDEESPDETLDLDLVETHSTRLLRERALRAGTVASDCGISHGG